MPDFLRGPGAPTAAFASGTYVPFFARRRSSPRKIEPRASRGGEALLALALFAAASSGLVYVSRVCLRDPRTHGFYRFFAWEFLLVSILLNLGHWFRDPFSAPQIVSWTLLIVSVYLLVHGVHSLRTIGKPDKYRNEDAALIGIERTRTLVTTGAYRYIRHPIYSSGLFLAWGVFFKQPSWPNGFLASAATVFLVITAKVEEAECRRFFGPDYRTYVQQSKMFIPFLF